MRQHTKEHMNLIRKLAERQANADARPLPHAHTRREKSAGEAMLEYHEPGYGLHFCLHGRTYYEICFACKRTRREANLNLSRI